jgi:hypothetical protein
LAVFPKAEVAHFIPPMGALIRMHAQADRVETNPRNPRSSALPNFHFPVSDFQFLFSSFQFPVSIFTFSVT